MDLTDDDSEASGPTTSEASVHLIHYSVHFLGNYHTSYETKDLTRIPLGQAVRMSSDAFPSQDLMMPKLNGNMFATFYVFPSLLRFQSILELLLLYLGFRDRFGWERV